MIERNLPIQYTVDPGLRTHTMIWPANLSKATALPIVLWENGGCEWNSTYKHKVLLERLAGAGVFVLARGGAGETGPVPSPTPANLPVYNAYVQEMKKSQLQALDWLLAENARPGSALFKRLDPTKIVAMGYSCGGYLGFENAVADRRIRSVLMFNSSPDSRWTPEQVRNAFAQLPAGTTIGMFDGGMADIAYRAAAAAWAQLPSHLPGIFANWTDAGHGGFWTNEGAVQYQPDLAEFAIHWVDYTTVSGSAAAKAALLGTPCSICDNPAISVQAKHWNAFSEPDGPNNTGQANKR